MHPAPSVIIFTVLAGIGFGLLAFLGAGYPAPVGWPAFFHWGLGYSLAVGGLLASTFHLGNPQRFLRAFTQWRSSWLSREAIASVACLLALAPVALSDWLGLGWPRALGLIGAALALATIFCTAMIYAQLKTIPRWNHWTTPALFMAFAGAGGAILAGQSGAGAVMSALLVALLLTAFRIGDGAFAARAQTLGTATGLGTIGPVQGAVRVFEQPHTSPNYLMREMIYLVARKHIRPLRSIALICAGIGPAVLLTILPPVAWAFATIAAVHLIGAFAARWLFFAQAEHVVGLYYGQR
jgi:DMSO reductase anchor subunit